MKNFRFLLTLLACFFIPVTHAFSQNLDSVNSAMQKGDFKKSLSLVMPMANDGVADAQVLLGAHFMMGLGTEIDPETAIEWYQKAAEQDNADGLALMASIHRDGIYLEKNPLEAIKLFTKSGTLGNYIAFALIGLMFEEADGVDQDYLKALMWYEISIANGGTTSLITSLRDALVDKMTVEEISTAQELAQQCMNSRYKNCDLFDKRVLTQLYCSLTNVQGGVLGQNDSWPQLGQNAWSKIILDKPVPVEKSGQESLGQGMLLNYQTMKIENIDEVISAILFLDVAVPGFEGVNSINSYSQLNLRLQYRCFDQRLSFIRNIVGEY